MDKKTIEKKANEIIAEIDNCIKNVEDISRLRTCIEKRFMIIKDPLNPENNVDYSDMYPKYEEISRIVHKLIGWDEKLNCHPLLAYAFDIESYFHGEYNGEYRIKVETIFDYILSKVRSIEKLTKVEHDETKSITGEV
jgi:hypothetical protein